MKYKYALLYNNNNSFSLYETEIELLSYISGINDEDLQNIDVYELGDKVNIAIRPRHAVITRDQYETAPEASDER